MPTADDLAAAARLLSAEERWRLIALIEESLLDVVEDAFDLDVVDVGVGQAEPLRLLERAHAAARREHEDLDAALAAQRMLGGTPCPNQTCP